ncbi:putative Ran GTPase activator [Obelidium mucronatum]|nr:putative Ran GTPase activator [Obelidium mucronatum]
MTSSNKYSLEGRVLKLNAAADADAVVAELNLLPDLDEIVFSGSTFGVEAAKAVAEALKSKTGLKIANLSDIFTGRLKDEIPQALDAFVDAFVDKKSLQVIDLSDNAFGPVGAAPIRRLFIENRSITTLKLNNNGLGIEGGRLIATSLLDAAAANSKEGANEKTQNALPNMNTIIMGRNRLESASARNLSMAFPVLPNLIELRLPQNGIRPDGISVLLEALRVSCPLLQILDVQDNTFTKEGSKALAKSLPSWPHLRILNIGDCLLGKAGSKIFFKALAPPQSPLLETLIYTFNEMDLEGAKLIPAALANKPRLSTLHLNGNTFDAEDDVVDQIRGILRSNGHVDGLDELEDMEEPDSDVEEEDADDDDDVVEDKSDAVDELADALGGVKV